MIFLTSHLLSEFPYLNYFNFQFQKLFKLFQLLNYYELDNY